MTSAPVRAWHPFRVHQKTLSDVPGVSPTQPPATICEPFGFFGPFRFCLVTALVLDVLCALGHIVRAAEAPGNWFYAEAEQE